ncbi:MAG: type III-B CRISPR-associated protein Cas10/Cmr2, partial [Campylobacterales bacterium]
KDVSPYYALIMFDGDKMGDWLSGKFLKNDEELESFHRTLSKNLASFAEELKSKSETSEFPVSVVYAGGDDFLGLCNLNNLFQVLKYLRKRWDEVVNTDELKNFVKDGKEFTFSVGITIAHTKIPFHYVLKEARWTEKDAKNLFERNAICFKFLKRSGEIRETGVKNSLEVLELMERVMNSFQEGVPSRFVSKLDRELRETRTYSLVNFDRKLVPEKGYEFVDEEWHKMVETEIARNLKRGYEGDGIEEKIGMFKELLKKEREFVGEMGMKKLAKILKGKNIYLFDLQHKVERGEIEKEEVEKRVKESLKKGLREREELFQEMKNYIYWYTILLYILQAIYKEIKQNQRSETDE